MINLTVSQTEILLESTEVQGFPVVSGDEHRTLLGYMGRAEIKYILGGYSCFPLAKEVDVVPRES
jgi:hypothetical protein